MKNRGATSDEMVLYRYCILYKYIYFVQVYIFLQVYVCVCIYTAGSDVGQATAGDREPVRPRGGRQRRRPLRACAGSAPSAPRGPGHRAGTVDARTREAVQALTSLDDERTGRCDC